MSTTDQLTALLRRHGRKVTAQRRALFAALQAYGRHATAEELYARVRRERPRLSLTTVYNTLHELVELGQLRRVELGDGTIRFDPNIDQHAHLVCRRCRRTEDLPATDYVVGLPLVSARGYRQLEHELVFLGLCPACQTVAEPGPAPPTDRPLTGLTPSLRSTEVEPIGDTNRNHS
jgi:Fe2+ or Zn2+ uptake regulation protein